MAGGGGRRCRIRGVGWKGRQREGEGVPVKELGREGALWTELVGGGGRGCCDLRMGEGDDGDDSAEG